MNEQEIKSHLERNDWPALARIADSLIFFHHMTTDEVLRLFERCGADVELLKREMMA